MKKSRKNKSPRFPTCSKRKVKELYLLFTSSHLRERLHDSVQQSSDPLGHLEQLEDPRYPQHSHHADDGGVDREDLALDLLQSDTDD